MHKPSLGELRGTGGVQAHIARETTRQSIFSVANSEFAIRYAPRNLPTVCDTIYSNRTSDWIKIPGYEFLIAVRTEPSTIVCIFTWQYNVLIWVPGYPGTCTHRNCTICIDVLFRYVSLAMCIPTYCVSFTGYRYMYRVVVQRMYNLGPFPMHTLIT